MLRWLPISFFPAQEQILMGQAERDSTYVLYPYSVSSPDLLSASTVGQVRGYTPRAIQRPSNSSSTCHACIQALPLCNVDGNFPRWGLRVRLQRRIHLKCKENDKQGNRLNKHRRPSTASRPVQTSTLGAADHNQSRGPSWLTDMTRATRVPG